MTILMLAPAPSMTFTGNPSGATYVADLNGIIAITNGSAADQTALQNAGCYTLLPFGGTMLTTQLQSLGAAMIAANALPGLLET